MSSGVFHQHVPRFCRVLGTGDPAGDANGLGADGFGDEAPALQTDSAALKEGDLALPETVAAAGAMVLLGEPGGGKTSVLAALTADIPQLAGTWTGEADACAWVTGADLTEHTYHAQLGHLLTDLNQASGGVGTLTIVVDQADESGMLQQLPARLAGSLRGQDVSQVRMLIACRSADYPGRMTRVLSDAFKVCHRVDLVPLRRSDAVNLVDSLGLPGTAVVAAAEQARAQALACVPLTLELLVLTYRTDGSLTGAPRDLFRRGVELLVEEHDADRVTSVDVSTTPAQRLVVAGRIAAWMLLNGRRTLWSGKGLQIADLDLPVGSLVDGVEHTAAGQFQVSTACVRETLATALFTEQGDNRIAFRHSSLAAYLAASYLTDRKVPPRQLRDLFLVGDPADDTASLPGHLRETGAWLVALEPDHTAWLATADPESLAAHSALVRSDPIRKLIVERLLDRAAQVELSDIRWQMSHWDLHHPDLAAQIIQALDTAPASAAQDWPTQARVRLAVRLARDAAAPDPALAASLLAVALDEKWLHTERRIAATAAHTCDPATAVPALRTILDSLSDPEHAARVDPDDSLRGTVLGLLWPAHLETETMIAALRQPLRPYDFAIYGAFLNAMPRHCNEDQLTEVLAWAARAWHVQPSPTDDLPDFQADPATGHVVAPSVRTRPNRFLPDSAMINTLVDRTLHSEQAAEGLPALASILIARIDANLPTYFPDALQPDEHGNEAPETTKLRRALAEALINEISASSARSTHSLWMVIHDWQAPTLLRRRTRFIPPQHERRRLLDSTDFAWALERTQAASLEQDRTSIELYGQLSAWLFSPDDAEAVELAYDPDHPAWPHLKHLYEPMALDSPLAQALREDYHARSPQVRPESGAFVAAQRDRLTRARAGDNDGFWQLLWALRADPYSLQPGKLTPDVETWPGSAVLGPGFTDFSDLALHYLATAHDHGEEWLGQSRIDYRAWAGYVALTHLHLRGRLDQVPTSAWSSWTAAILDTDLRPDAATQHTRADLLHLAAEHAPEHLASCIDLLFRRNIASGFPAYRARDIDPLWSSRIQDTLENLAVSLFRQLHRAAPGNPPTDLDDIADELENLDGRPMELPEEDGFQQAAMSTCDTIVSNLLAAQSQRALTLAEAALTLVTAGAEDAPEISVRAARALLIQDVAHFWPRIEPLTQTSDDFSRRLAEACAQPTVEVPTQPLDEAALAEMYQWLSGLYGSQDQDVWMPGVRAVDSREQGRQWRNAVLGELSRRGTAESVLQLLNLTKQHPGKLSLSAALISARTQFYASSRVRADVADLVQVLTDPRRRLINTTSGLLDVVVDTLNAIAADVAPHGELLWDRTPGKSPRAKAKLGGAVAIPDVWRPKPEAALSAYLAHVLQLRLGGHGVLVNREVLIQPTDAYGAGERVDILVQATSIARSGSVSPTPDTLRLVIEVKGPWNKDLLTAQETQLARTYLPEVPTDAGVYLVGWYPLDQWTASDDRKAKAKVHSAESLREKLQIQAATLAGLLSIHVQAMVLVIDRPHKQP
ncbi:hypothetical protein [Streptacidiphilus melanogenes]|uniref:hypothetical protein n=1 Tax=Streptacidiphilus melanogenes TaxID=411235 RepID=UPI0005A99AF5|nr:hypothetical protein [Streptacidiphilus melanogenes]